MKYRRLLSFLFVLIFVSSVSASHCSAGITDFLCERGIYYYENKDFANAFREFKKVLLLDPENEIALDYLNLLKKWVVAKEEPVVELKEEKVEGEQGRKKAVFETLDEVESAIALQREIARKEKVIPVKEVPQEIAEVLPPPPSRERVALKKEPIEFLILDEKVKATQPDTLLEIELGKPLIVQGNQISRFLVTGPKMLTIERKAPDKIEVRPLDLGTSFLHIWDNQGRWTFKVRNIPTRPVGPTLEEIRRREAERAENFKIRYGFNRDVYYSGTRPGNFSRQTLAFNQWLGIDGETPYGRFDSSARIAKHEEYNDLTHLTMGLTEAEIGPLKDFDLRGFDYSMYSSELGFPGMSLRGLRFDQRLEADRGDYTFFWGREGQGTLGRLSPGLEEAEDAYLEGARFLYRPWENFNYQLGYYHGYGSERDASLQNDALDLMVNFDSKNLGLSAQGGYNTARFAYALNSVFKIPGLRIAAEYRNIYPEYTTIIGRPSRLGEMGGLCFVEFDKIENLFIKQRLDVYQDRLYPNPERLDAWNIESDTDVSYRLSEDTTLNANFRYWDEKGRISPRRERSMGGGISKSFDFLKTRDLSIYSNYQYEVTKNFNSIASDYDRNRITTGMRLNLFDGFSVFASEEFSWLHEVSADQSSLPRAWEAGIDYNHQVGRLPLYASLRASYRDEKDTSSTYSFLSGEDSLDIQGGLSYQLFGDWEVFLDGRIRQVWPNNLEETGVYAEGEFITGARMLFDTGLTWNPVGSIYGVVFKDINGDGLHMEDEPGIEGVKIFLGEDKASISDKDGKFIFPKVRAKQAYLTLGLSSVPSGFVPSTATSQKVPIEHGGVSVVNFGLSFRCEVVGSVFIDANGNGRFDPEEEGQQNVILRLEDGTEATTNDQGRFYFRRVSPGEHILTLEINSVPIHLLPKVPMKKEMFITEGASYIYNIPLELLK